MRWFVLLFCVVWPSMAAGFGTNSATRVLQTVPFPSTVQFARANKIPLTRIDSLLGDDVVKSGDSVTVLVTLVEKGQRSQWILFPQISGDPAPSNGVMVIHNTFGNTFQFASHPTPVSLRTVGPFLEGTHSGRVKDTKASLTLDKGYLGLGLDRAAAAVARLDSSKNRKGSFRSGTTRFSDADIKASKEFAAEWKLTPAEERALGGTYPALLSYFDIVQNNDSLQGILASVIDRPSLFSLAANFGISSIEFNWQGARPSALPASAWGMSDDIPIYEIPMALMLNNHPSLNITMIVTAPRPPLLTSAGIIGVLGEKPGKSEPFLTIRIVSGHLAPRATSNRPGQ